MEKLKKTNKKSVSSDIALSFNTSLMSCLCFKLVPTFFSAKKFCFKESKNYSENTNLFYRQRGKKKKKAANQTKAVEKAWTKLTVWEKYLTA